MARKSKLHNTDYITKKNKYLVKCSDNQVVVWIAPNQCRVYKQLVINF